MPSPREKHTTVVLDERHKRLLEELAERERKSRSAVVRDAIERMASAVPDADSLSDD